MINQKKTTENGFVRDAGWCRGEGNGAEKSAASINTIQQHVTPLQHYSAFLFLL
jgi:hypothetical protein